jgi:glutamine amidotransferase
MIAIIDYGLGNVKAFANVYKNLNLPAIIVKRPNELKNVGKVILPGVGAFDYAMQKLDQSGMRQFLDEMVIERNVPVLGICVGMQMLASSSDEGKLSGLGWIDGVVKRFNFSSLKKPLMIPHMGWNSINQLKKIVCLAGLTMTPAFIFCIHIIFSVRKMKIILQLLITAASLLAL